MTAAVSASIAFSSGLAVTEGDLGETRGHRPEGGAVFLVAGGQRQPRVAVVAALGADDPWALRVSPGELDGKIHRLASAGRKDGARELVAGASSAKRFQPSIARCFADEVVVADVELSMASVSVLYDLGVAVAQVIDPAVAVAVDDPLFARHVPDVDPLPPAEDEIDTHLLEEGGLAGVDVVRRRAR